MMDNHPHTLSAFYDPDWKPLYATYRVKEHWRDIERPANLDEMLSSRLRFLMVRFCPR